MGKLVLSYWWVKLVWLTGGHGLGMTGLELLNFCSDLEQVVCVLSAASLLPASQEWSQWGG